MNDTCQALGEIEERAEAASEEGKADRELIANARCMQLKLCKALRRTIEAAHEYIPDDILFGLSQEITDILAEK